MRLRLTALLLLLLISFSYAQVTPEGGNLTEINITAEKLTDYWAGIVGWLNGSLADTTTDVSMQDTPQPTVYTNEPNGSYVKYYNDTMIITRLDFKPDVDDLLFIY